MAEKEERIAIAKMITGLDDEGSAQLDHFKIYSRQEAIERMAKAMFEWQRPGSRGDVPIEDVWQDEKFGFENLAEAALNALLEGK